MKILVVGGGIAGLATAHAVGLAGFEAVVIERATELKEPGAGITLAPNAVRALDILGLGALLRRDAVVGTHLTLRTWHGRTLFDVDYAGRGWEILAVHRGDLQRRLLESLPTASFGSDTRARAFTRMRVALTHYSKAGRCPPQVRGTNGSTHIEDVLGIEATVDLPRP